MRIINALYAALTGAAIITANAYGQQVDARSTYDATAAAIVDDKGNMRVPVDYRTTYQMLGTWAVAATDASGSKEMHVVYASPGAIAAYREDRRFPDGTVLVKEVFKTITEPMTTGTVSSASTLLGWFVMVKDNNGRFPENKLWGDGWGWAWFEASDANRTISKDYRRACMACHTPAKASDWLYIHGYPPLKR
jgi:hypothetical protein